MSYINYRIINPLQEIRLYAKLVEEHLEEQIHLVNQRYAIDSSMEDTWESIFDGRFEEIHKYSGLPGILRNSLLVSIFSYFENQLVLLIKSIQINNNIELNLSDLRGTGVEKTQIYLRKICGVDISFDSKNWQYVKNAIQIRNCIVHNGGDIEEYSKKTELRRIIGKLENVFEGGNYIIVVNNKFCFEIIDVMELILLDLYKISFEHGLLSE
ncbi:hypothetical protein [Paenibacillus sp. FSL P2-0136]|uniref:hypothetical protein n=1 Tax=Paenibacillus sp. FSL P2-0136 TaxID=2975317 RepID=UPI0030D80CE1